MHGGWIVSRHARNSVLWAGLAAGLLLLGLTRTGDAAGPVAAAPRVQVVVVGRPIAQGQRIVGADLGTRTLPAAAVEAHQLVEPGQAIGRRAAVALAAGSPLMDAELAQGVRVRDAYDVAVRLDEVAGIPAGDLAGLRADLYLTEPGRPPRTRCVMRDVLVVSARAGADGSVATLRLPRELVAVAIAAEGGGACDWWLTLPGGTSDQMDSLTVRCLLVNADRDLAARVAGICARLPGVELVGSCTALQVFGAPPACDVMIVGDGGDRPASSVAGELAAAQPRVGLVLLVAGADVDTYRAALSAGVSAVVSSVPSPGELASAVVDAARRSDKGTGRRAGAVTAVVGSAGGVGVSVIALALARMVGATLADLSGGWISPIGASDGPSAGSVVDLARIGQALTAAVESITVHHPSGVRSLPGPAAPELLELLPAGLGAGLVRELRAAGRLAVVDAARQVLVASDRTLVVVRPDLRSVTAARALVDAATGWGVDAERLGVVINRWSHRAELSRRGVERACGCPVLATVRARRRGLVAYDNLRADIGRWPAGTPFGDLSALATQLQRVA